MRTCHHFKKLDLKEDDTNNIHVLKWVPSEQVGGLHLHMLLNSAIVCGGVYTLRLQRLVFSSSNFHSSWFSCIPTTSQFNRNTKCMP